MLSQVRYSDSLVEELYMPVEQIKFDSEDGTPEEDSAAPELDANLACFEVFSRCLTEHSWAVLSRRGLEPQTSEAWGRSHGRFTEQQELQLQQQQQPAAGLCAHCGSPSFLAFECVKISALFEDCFSVNIGLLKVAFGLLCNML